MSLIGLSAAAKLVGRDQSTIHRAMQSGRLPFLWTGGRRMIDTADLEKIFQKKQKAGTNRKIVITITIDVAVLCLLLLFPAAAVEPPYSCRLLYAEQKRCAFGSCDKRAIERLTKECLRDGGRP